jgi:hypothetical protein
MLCVVRRDERRDIMKITIAAAAIAAGLIFAPAAAHADRAVNTGLGVGTGLLVFGPVGAVVGGVVGYTAGDSIARSWGVSRPHRRPVRRVRPAND